MNKELLKLIIDNDEQSIDVANKLEATEIVDTLKSVDDKASVEFCKNLDNDLLADVVILLDSKLQQSLLHSLNDEDLRGVMNKISVEDTLKLLEDMPKDVIRRIAEKDEIEKLLELKKYSSIKKIAECLSDIELAEILGKLDDKDIPVLFRLLPKTLAADTFVEMDRDAKELLLTKLNDKEIKNVVNDLFLDDTADLVEEMPANVVKRLLKSADKETRDGLNELLKYPKDSAGSIMTIEYVALRPNMTIGEALGKIKESAIDKETIYTCYVTDKTKRLIGYVPAKDLMINDDNMKIVDVMHDNTVYAFTTDDQEEVARKISDYGFLALPIVDQEMRLVGIVTVDDAMEVLEQENEEDIAKMSGLTPSETTYLKTSVWGIWKNRVPWLLLLMISATFTGLIINSYESKLNAISPVLFACVPMLMDTGGNSGSQASVTVIRSLALGELETRDVLRVLWKELRVAILLGLTLAVACFGKLMLIDNLIFGFSDYTPIRCMIVAMAMFATIFIAKLVGCTLPLLAKKFKLDPAVVASPFITTIVDALSLIIFCLLSIAILG